MTRKRAYLRETRYVTRVAAWVPNAQTAIECMRYDACYPESEAEALKLCRLMGGRSLYGDHIVRFIRAARTDGALTTARWESFGCRVLDVRHPDDAALSDAALERLSTGEDLT